MPADDTWTPEQDALLRQALETFGDNSWLKVKKMVGHGKRVVAVHINNADPTSCCRAGQAPIHS